MGRKLKLKIKEWKICVNKRKKVGGEVKWDMEDENAKKSKKNKG